MLTLTQVATASSTLNCQVQGVDYFGRKFKTETQTPMLPKLLRVRSSDLVNFSQTLTLGYTSFEFDSEANTNSSFNVGDNNHGSWNIGSRNIGNTDIGNLNVGSYPSAPSNIGYGNYHDGNLNCSDSCSMELRRKKQSIVLKINADFKPGKLAKLKDVSIKFKGSWPGNYQASENQRNVKIALSVIKKAPNYLSESEVVRLSKRTRSTDDGTMEISARLDSNDQSRLSINFVSNVTQAWTDKTIERKLKIDCQVVR
jgi:hypothetical protein